MRPSTWTTTVILGIGLASVVWAIPLNTDSGIWQFRAIQIGFALIVVLGTGLSEIAAVIRSRRP